MSENKKSNVSNEGNPSPLPAKMKFMDGCPPPLAAKRAALKSKTNSSSTQTQKPDKEKTKK